MQACVGLRAAEVQIPLLNAGRALYFLQSSSGR